MTAASKPRPLAGVKLKPCPWCGGLALVDMSVSGTRFAGICMNKQCDAIGPWRASERSAAEAWNRRSPRKGGRG